MPTVIPWDVKIELLPGQSPTFNAKPKTLTPKEKRAFATWFEEAQENNWITPSTARHSCGLLFVPKKDGSLRTCIDYRPLNEVYRNRIYAPYIGHALRQEIVRHRWYSKIDLKNAFYHLKIEDASRWLTAFRTPRGIYEFNVLPFGLKSAPGEFQRFIEFVLSEFIGPNVTVHIDDILVHHDTKAGCAALTRKVQQVLRQWNLTINESKSVFNVPEVVYCGFKFHHGKITPVAKIETIATWPVPTCKRHVQVFMGMVNPYRDHISRFATIAKPMYDATGKEWKWGQDQLRAFTALKREVTRMITTTEHHPHQPCELTTDASLVGASAILTQNGKTTAVVSRALTPAERNYDAAERELVAVIYALDQWQHNLEECPLITVQTDNMINASVLRESTSNRRKNRWIAKLMAYNVTWKHIPGITNPADPASRRPDYGEDTSSEWVKPGFKVRRASRARAV